jgi:hypothetical protein
MAHLSEPVRLDVEVSPLRELNKGGGAWSLQPNRQEEWAWMENVFTPLEIKAIIALGEADELDQGRTGGRHSPQVRDSFVQFLFPNATTQWIFEKLSGVINEMNARYWGFDLSGFEQGLQFTRYRSTRTALRMALRQWDDDRPTKTVTDCPTLRPGRLRGRRPRALLGT